MAESETAAADILLNQPGPTPDNAPGAQPNDPSSAGQNIMPNAPVKPKDVSPDSAISPISSDAPAPAASGDDAPGGPPWPAILGGAALAAVGVGAAVHRRRQAKAASAAPDEQAKGVARTAGGDVRNPNALLPAGEGVKVSDVVTINKPASELFTFWRSFANLPQFMKYLDAVTVTDSTHSHWVAKAPLGKTVQWDAEIINEKANELIAWKTLPGADVDSAGSVRFDPAPGGRGTEVRVSLEYKPPAGKVGALVAKLFGEEPQQQISSDLRRFKQLMEAGELSTTEGQPAGKRSASSKVMEKLGVA